MKLSKHYGLILATLITGIIALASQLRAADIPSPKEGDRWEFKAATIGSSSSSSDRLDGNYEVAYVGGKLQAYDLADGKRGPVGPRSGQQLLRMIAFGQDEEQYLKFPLAIGTKWTANYSVQSPGSRRTSHRSADFMVQEQVQTKTAAGNFQTLKLKGLNSGGQVSQEWTYFYSPDCKCIAKFFYDSAVGGNGGKLEIELTKFTPAP